MPALVATNDAPSPVDQRQVFLKVEQDARLKFIC